ncbi:MAG TPA: hypothetical protein DCG75_11250 [Bacteroidales bacterium]|jgi:hypothetical protein|nr:hypothetical protein [Bacteroidales bacterium]
MRKLSLTIIAFAILLSSCKDKNKSALLPNVTGKSGEVVLVIEADQWDSNVGMAFKKQLSQEYPALPQQEPMFDLIHIPFSAFSNIFKTHRNVVFAKIDKNLHEAKILVQDDVWANPQIVVNVIAPDESSLEAIILEKGDLIVDRIFKKEMERYATNYKKYQQIGIADRIENKFGIRLTVPRGYTIDVDTTDFIWMENRGRGDLVQGILIYSYDKPEVELTTDYLFAKRTQFTKRFVPGPNEGSYMAVETESTPFRREIKINNIDVIELRNLWKVENDFMGGPFISFAMIDEKQNKVINIDGFIYAPQFDKRDYLRQVEAILNSVQMPVNGSAN